MNTRPYRDDGSTYDRLKLVSGRRYRGPFYHYGLIYIKAWISNHSKAHPWCFGWITLKRKCRHFDEIFITGCTGSCHFDNFQCSQWWKFHQNEDISVSVNQFHFTLHNWYNYLSMPGLKLNHVSKRSPDIYRIFLLNKIWQNMEDNKVL